MFDKYTSERLLQELPRPLVNFIWYLWEINYDPNAAEFRVTLQDGGSDGQRFIIHSTGSTVTQNFGPGIDTEIVIRRAGERYFMEYY